MYLALPSCPQSGHSSLIGNTLRSILPSIISKTIMARDGKCSVHRNPSLAISVSALGLPIVRETHIRGSLIPQHHLEIWGLTDRIASNGHESTLVLGHRQQSNNICICINTLMTNLKKNTALQLPQINIILTILKLFTAYNLIQD